MNNRPQVRTRSGSNGTFRFFTGRRPVAIAPGSDKNARIADLTSRLSVERRFIQNDAALVASFQHVELLFPIENGNHFRRVETTRVVPVEFVRADPLQHLGIYGADLGFPLRLPDAALILQFLQSTLESLVVGLFLEYDPLFFKVNPDQIARRTERVVELCK